MPRDAETAAFLHVFGDQPITREVHLRAPDDEGAGIPVVYRDLVGVQNAQLLKKVGEAPNEIERAGAWVWETLAWGIESVDGKPFPADIAKRREIVMAWAMGASEKLAEGYTVFQAEIGASWELVMSSPFRSGANDGPSFAPKAAGQDG